MDPSFLSAKRLAAAVRRGQFGCLELLDHFITRVERYDGKLNAVVVRDFERARKSARAMDRQRAKGATGPLFGVPMTVKESFDLTDLPTTWGYTERREHRAGGDALAVLRLRKAGAVVFGKTNVPVGLADWQSDNPIHGATSNPWNLLHTPGGSSGGSAAALAAGLTGLDIGSDIGGSIRVPAHYCGVFGHKPTWGLCPTRGQSLTGAAAMGDISVIGPLARSADDLLLALDAIAGPDDAETQLAIDLPPPRARRLDELRIAVWPSQAGQETDAETVAKLEELARFLRRSGAKVSMTARPELDPTEAFHLYLRLLNAALSARMSEDVLARMRDAAQRRPSDDLSADAIMVRTVDMTHRDWLRLNERRFQLRRAWGAFFEDWDVLLCPVIATTALPHMQEGETWERSVTVNGREMPYNDMLFWPGVTCAFHLPASTAPLGVSRAGLPIGVQIVGPQYGDRTTIEVARLLEKSWQGFVPPAGWE